MTEKGAIIEEREAHKALLKYVGWLENYTQTSHPTMGCAKAKSFQALGRLQTEVIDAVPDMEVSLRNAGEPSFIEDDHEWVLWCGPKESAQKFIDTAKIMTKALRGEDET